MLTILVDPCQNSEEAGKKWPAVLTLPSTFFSRAPWKTVVQQLPCRIMKWLPSSRLVTCINQQYGHGVENLPRMYDEQPEVVGKGTNSHTA